MFPFYGVVLVERRAFHLQFRSGTRYTTMSVDKKKGGEGIQPNPHEGSFGSGILTYNE